MSAAAAALAGLPFPVTIAIDPAAEDAAAQMARYRDAGLEVAVMAKLPEGAQPADVEVTFESVFSSLPEAIAVVARTVGAAAASDVRLLGDNTLLRPPNVAVFNVFDLATILESSSLRVSLPKPNLLLFLPGVVDLPRPHLFFLG